LRIGRGILNFYPEFAYLLKVLDIALNRALRRIDHHRQSLDAGPCPNFALVVCDCQ
jgi:hypothetical protein